MKSRNMANPLDEAIIKMKRKIFEKQEELDLLIVERVKLHRKLLEINKHERKEHGQEVER